METNAHTTPTPAQVQLFDIAFKAARGIDKAINSQLGAMKDWLDTQYGTTPPTYEQFWADRDALKALAKDKGLVDDQWVRKPYNMAVKAMYGELPVSTTLAAVAKREARPEAAKPTPAAAPTKITKVAMPKDAETAVRQMLEHYGFARVLIAFSTILAEHKETLKEAQRVRNLGDSMLANQPAPQTNGRTHRRANRGAAVH
jgi:hypothetical protein